MINKVFPAGQSFRETCHYVSADLERSQVLAVEGVRGRDYELMAGDFELQHRLKPEKEKPVYHGMLSFPTGEVPNDERMVEIAQRHLEKIGMTHTQYAIVKHMDTSHMHLHVIANRVCNNGEIIDEGLIVERGIKAARELTREYNLSMEEKKNLELTNRASLNEVDAQRYKLYDAIRELLPVCRQLEDLEQKLLERGITTRYKQDPASGARVGISFRIGNYAFKGSQVDKDFSIRRLDQQLALQRVQEQEQVQKQEQVKKLEQEVRQEVTEELRQSRGLRLGM
jgi:hypothetical protein